MKKDYQKPTIEIVKFQDSEIETQTSTQDVGVEDWFEQETIMLKKVGFFAVLLALFSFLGFSFVKTNAER